MLAEIGSDINAKNYQGLSLMHVAAQGDQAKILIYLKSIGFNFDEEDYKGSLPLH